MALSARPTAKRHRRTREEAADFRNQLIAAARELFASEGFRSVSIRRIADRANCPPMTFYVYFKSKRALLYHIWSDVFGDLRDACTQAVGPDMRPQTRLRTYGLTMVDYWLAHPESYRIVYLTQDFLDAKDDQYFTDTMDEAGRLPEFEEALSAGVSDGVFRPLDVVLVSQVLFVATLGLAHSLITIPEFPWRRDALVPTTFDLLLSGLEQAPAAVAPRRCVTSRTSFGPLDRPFRRTVRVR